MKMICGFHAVINALTRHSENILSLYYQENKTGERFEAIQKKAEEAGILMQSISANALDKLVKNQKHQGFAANIRCTPPPEEKDLLTWLETTDRVPLLLILEGLEDPHNVGACLRSAEALGVDWVIMPRSRGAPANATISKVSCGADQYLSIVTVANIARCIHSIQQRGVWVVGTSGPQPGQALLPLTQVDFTQSTALIMGAEGAGLRHLTRKACDVLASIPLVGITESLNVSVATGICLYECARQRGLQGLTRAASFYAS